MMLIRPISAELARKFPNQRFILEKLENGTVIAYGTEDDRRVSGQATAGLPAGAGFIPGAHPEYSVQVTVHEGKGMFYHDGMNLPYSAGSRFFIRQHTLHGFVKVMTATVFTKTIVNEFMMDSVPYTPQIVH